MVVVEEEEEEEGEEEEDEEGGGGRRGGGGVRGGEADIKRNGLVNSTMYAAALSAYG